MKERDSPFGLSITATDFYVYVRDKDFFVYMHGRKERKEGRRQEIILVNYLVKISEGMLEIQISVDMWKEGRKEGRKERTLVDYVLQILISVFTLIPTS